MPTPPAAACTSSVSPGCSVRAEDERRVRGRIDDRERRALLERHAVGHPVRGTRPARRARSAKPPSPADASTRSPTAKPVDAGPDLATTPASSAPGTNGKGGFTWYFPCTIRMSKKLQPAARTSTREHARARGAARGPRARAAPTAPSSDRRRSRACGAALRPAGQKPAIARRLRIPTESEARRDLPGPESTCDPCLATLTKQCRATAQLVEPADDGTAAAPTRLRDAARGGHLEHGLDVARALALGKRSRARAACSTRSRRSSSPNRMRRDPAVERCISRCGFDASTFCERDRAPRRWHPLVPELDAPRAASRGVVGRARTPTCLVAAMRQTAFLRHRARSSDRYARASATVRVQGAGTARRAP